MISWDRLQSAEWSWAAPIATLLALVVLLVLRGFLAVDQRASSRLPIFFLGLDLVLRLGMVTGLAMGFGVAPWFHLLSVLFLSFGLAGLADMLIFDFALRRFRHRFPSILRDLLQAVVFAACIMGVLRKGGVNLLSLVTTSAVLTAVIGLALQSTIANLFAGLSLQLERQLGIGDWIQVGDKVGRIVQTRWHSTSLCTKDGDLVIVPNGELIKVQVVNFSRPRAAHRLWLRVSFHYRHSPNEVKRALFEAVRDAPGVLSTPPPDVVQLEFGESGIVYALRYWIDDFERDAPIDSEVRTRIWYAAKRHNLKIPFPIRSVYKTEMPGVDSVAEREHDLAERRALLARIDLFASLLEADRQLLAEGMRRVKFATGEQIIRQGHASDSLYLVEKGEVRVELAAAGAVSEVARLGPGEFFGEMSLMTGAPCAATCAARSEVSCFVVDHPTFQRLIDARPEVADEVSAVLAARQVALEEAGEGLSTEARSRRAAEARSHLVARIRQFFDVG